MAAITAAVVVAGAAVAGAVSSAKQASAAKKSARAQQQAQAVEEKRAGIANARERRGAIRNARVARASVESQAAGFGITGSSSAIGSASNIQSVLGANLSFLDQNAILSQQAGVANRQAAGYQSQMLKWQGIGQMASAIGSAAGAYTGTTPQGTS